jgi:subtilisin family serine protease
VNICPADEPVPVSADAKPWPPRTVDATAGAGVSILVIDTGVPADHAVTHPQIGGLVITDPVTSHRTDFTELVSLPPPFDEVRVIKEYAGHGLFIAGILSCVAPGAEIRPSNALQHAGAMPEADFGEALMYALDAQPEWPDIISLSAGCPTMDGLPLQGLEDFRQALREHPRTLLVAAAGNDATRFDAHPGPGDYQFWPAAYAPDDDDGVVSVGALARHHDRRACFTNYGSAITVYARGEDHVNAFLTGEYEYRHGNDPQCHSHEPPLYSPCSCVTSLPFGAHAVFRGWARWSGTSFATPLVAGMVAVHMQRTGERNARLAFADLCKREAQLIVEEGPGAPLRMHAFL